MKINKRQFKKWIAALDSGEYWQGKEQLQDVTGHCCLGVGCNVTIPSNKQRLNGDRLFGVVPFDQPHAPEWLKLINDDFYKKAGMQISEFNDSYGYTFPEIATLLELVYIHKILD